MPGPPPPPPPGPPPGPPPPMANMNNKKSSGNSGGLDMRGALLSQIQKGTQLKKVTTVDKSKPLAGRVADSSSNSTSPTKSRGPSSKTSPDSSTPSPIRQGGFSNLTDELQYKLTLKKNKNSPLKEAKSIVEPKESSPPSITSSSKSFVNEIKSKQSVISPQHQLSSSTTSHHTHTVSDAIPNKSSLFNNSVNSNNVNNNNNNNISKDSSYDNKSQSSAPKINHGKPNLAPKPPPQLSLAMNNNVNNNNNSSSSTSLNDGSRKSVARHQSMKSPRSPPIGLAPSTGPFNTENHFGTIRNPSSQNKTQEALNLQVVQKSVAQRPTNKPPPPPVPNRHIATNLTSQPHAKSTTALNNTHSDQSLSAPKRLPNSGSSNNINMMERNNVDVIDSTAPPLPPHRISSAQKAQQRNQQHQQQQQVINSQIPPEVPRRHSSMRTSIDNGGSNNNNRYPSPNLNPPPATRLVVDLEARYSLLFHSVSEFPAPKQFLNVNKTYPSKAVGPSNGI